MAGVIDVELRLDVVDKAKKEVKKRKHEREVTVGAPPQR